MYSKGLWHEQSKTRKQNPFPPAGSLVPSIDRASMAVDKGKIFNEHFHRAGKEKRIHLELGDNRLRKA